MNSTSFIYFVALIACVLAIECYQETVTGGSGSNPKTKINCTGNMYYCSKTSVMQGNVETVVRSCGNPLVCTNVGCTNQNGRTVCCCNMNLCNGAESTKLTISIIASIVFILTYIYN